MTIILDQIYVTLGKARILDGVSASLQPGRVTALIGPNGAGKTTLLRAMLGLVGLESGTIRIDGTALAEMPIAKRALRLGYLPQLANAEWNVNVRALVSLGRLPHHGAFANPGATDYAAIEAALIATDTLHFADRTIDSLSGGERARVFLARVLAGEPDWIFADEPLANLDPPHRHAVLKLLRAVAETGKGVVVTLHDLTAAAQFGEDFLALKSGHLIGTTLSPDILEAAFDIPFDRIPHGQSEAILPRFV
jgi:iron complex transport system ATP-binding protein